MQLNYTLRNSAQIDKGCVFYCSWGRVTDLQDIHGPWSITGCCQWGVDLCARKQEDLHQDQTGLNPPALMTQVVVHPSLIGPDFPSLN